jgi:hypothetical protein
MKGGTVPKKVFAPCLAILLFAGCLASVVSAQTSWWRTYGGTGFDAGRAVDLAATEGYVIAGSCTSSGVSSDVFLIRTDTLGDTLWTRTYGGTSVDAAYSVQETADSGYVIAGNTSSFGAGYNDVYLVRANAAGDTLWTRAYGGTSTDESYSVVQTCDGGFVIAGYTWSFGVGTPDSVNVYLVKTDARGDTLWTRFYGGIGSDVGSSVRQTSDSGYIIAGTTCTFGSTPDSDDVYLIKTDAQGDTLWTRTYGGKRNDGGRSVIQVADGGYVIAGYTFSFGAGSQDVYLIRTDASGDTLWTRTYGGASYDDGCSVQSTTDGGYIIAGATGSFGAGIYDVYLIKTDSQGDTLWTRTFGGASSDWSECVRQTPDGGYIVAGYTLSFGAGSCDVYLIKTDANGNVGVAEPLTVNRSSQARLLAQPNPFTSVTRVPGHEREYFAVSDVTGRQVAVSRGDRVGAGLRSGVYFLSAVGVRTGRVSGQALVKAAF